MPPAPRTLARIDPSAGVRSWYRLKLQALAREMALEALAIIRQPSQAQDAATADVMLLKRALAEWGVRWEQKMDRMAADVARLFASRSGRYLDAAFKRKLREAGFTVRFQPSAHMLQAQRETVAHNVGLIRSIPRKFHRSVEAAVSRAVTRGGDREELSTVLKRRYGVTYRRASLIARDQSAKAHAVFEAARREDLGITEAEWMHSHAGKTPRPEHVRWGRERRRFDVKKGLYSQVDREWQLPGTAINCRCGSRSIIPDSFVRRSERAAARRGKAQDVRSVRSAAPAA